MKLLRKIELTLIVLAILSFISAFVFNRFYGTNETYLTILKIGFLYSFAILILNFINRLESVSKLIGVFYVTFLIFSFQTFGIFVFKDFKWNLVFSRKELTFSILLISTALLVLFYLIKLIIAFVKRIKDETIFKRIESYMLVLCFALNIIGIYLHFNLVLLSFLLYGLGFTIVLNPLLLLNFIYKWDSKGLKFLFIFYFVISNKITLFFLFSFPEKGLITMTDTTLQTIWPTINIITGIIWAILLVTQKPKSTKIFQPENNHTSHTSSTSTNSVQALSVTITKSSNLKIIKSSNHQIKNHEYTNH
jgi:hypothetical protein